MDERAVSEVLSYTLVFTLIISSVAVVSVAGLGGIQDARDAEQMENSERAYEVLADNMEDITLRGAPNRATEIRLERSRMYFGDPVTIELELLQSGGPNQTHTWDTRPLILEGNRDRQLVYEAGATVRTNRDTEFLIDSPPFVFRDSPTDGDRLLLSFIDIDTDAVQSKSGSTILVRATESKRTVVVDDEGTYEFVNVTITSPRYEAWRAHLSEQPGVSCSLTGATNEVECMYVGAGKNDNIDQVYFVRHQVETKLHD